MPNIDLIKFSIFDKIFVKVKILMIIYDYIYIYILIIYDDLCNIYHASCLIYSSFASNLYILDTRANNFAVC